MNDPVRPFDIDGPRVIHGLSFDTYLSLPAISVHGLMDIERSPAHYRAALSAPRTATPAQQLGTLTHLAVLEWDRYQSSVVVAPDCDRRTRAGKEADLAFRDALADRPDAIIATADQDTRARAMREAVLSNARARALLSAGHAESSIVTRADDGVALKGRPDWLCADLPFVVELKTAIDASESEFSRAAGRYRYHMQAAFYLDLLEAVEPEPRAFVFLVVEPDAPHGVALYTPLEDVVHAGRVRYQRALDTYRACVESGRWPSYPDEIQPLSIPKWAL